MELMPAFHFQTTFVCRRAYQTEDDSKGLQGTLHAIFVYLAKHTVLDFIPLEGPWREWETCISSPISLENSYNDFFQSLFLLPLLLPPSPVI